MNSCEMKAILNANCALEQRLFYMGFYATTAKENKHCWSELLKGWNTFLLDDMNFFVHPKQSFYMYHMDNISIALIGHAYHPYRMMDNEDEILRMLTQVDNENFFDEICSLTGIYSIIWKDNEDCWKILGDASGMQTVYYCQNRDEIHISSHINLLGDILDLTIDPYVEHLSKYRFYKLLGDALPGDLTKFSQIKRLVPNHYVRFGDTVQCYRFHTPEVRKMDYEAIVDEASMLLHNNLQLISQKWKKPAISLTGGCDSKTTLACANGLYDRFSYFSYISSEEELVDAEAAHNICNQVLGYDDKHTIYTIPGEDEAFADIEAHRAVLFYNSGSLRKTNLNDVRKRCYFASVDDFDVEVKSWVSEVGRAYYSKRFNNRTKFPKTPTPRVCTTMYKFFFHNRKLVKQTDAVFAEYLKQFPLNSKTIPWQEQFFWEFRVLSWNGNVITGEHRYSYDIAIPYNNCKLLELLLSVPLQDRISDRLYMDMRKKMNSEIDATGIHVQNLKHTSNRAKIENLYFCLHSRFPL